MTSTGCPLTDGRATPHSHPWAPLLRDGSAKSAESHAGKKGVRPLFLSKDEKKAQQLVDQNKHIAKRLANNLGVGAQTAFRKNEKDKALWMYKMTRTLCKHLNDLRCEATVLNDLGVLHHSYQEYQFALTYFRQALAIHTEIGDEEGKKAARNNIEILSRKLRRRR